MEIETISYQQVIDGYIPQNDKYSLLAYALAEPRRTAFLTNPSLVDKTQPMIITAKENGAVVGRTMNLPSRFMADKQVFETIGGSAIEVAEEYRNGDAGILLMAYNMQNKRYTTTISSGFSRVAAKCHKAMGSKIFVFPQLIQIRNFTKILPVIGVPRIIAKLFGWIPTAFYYPFRFLIYKKSERIRNRYTVKKVNEVPEWVDDIVFNDGHRFMELHDSKWLQWNLDHMFHSNERNLTSFYTVSQDGKGIGFFMIKERFGSIESRGVKDAKFGHIVEWGTKDPKLLSEYSLQLMALSSFSKDVDLVYMASTDYDVVKKMKKFLLLRIRDAEVAFKDFSKKFKDANNQDLWRLRLGYGDTIMG